jgi:catalase (peroxidase I)
MMMKSFLLLLSLLSVANAQWFDVNAVKADLMELFTKGGAENSNNHGPAFIRVAWHCSGTYRATDGRGGCEGARIRFSPEKDWGDNAGVQDDIALLKPIKEKYGDALSMSDLIVLAGSTAVEQNGGPPIRFCPGRMDDMDGSKSVGLDTEMIYVDAQVGTIDEVRWTFAKMGMDDRETVALIGGGHAFGRLHADRSGFEGPWSSTPVTFSNEFFRNLVSLDYKEELSPTGLTQWRAGDVVMLTTDLVLRDDPAFRMIVNEYAADEALLRTEFAAAWQKLMEGGRDANVCHHNPVPVPHTVFRPDSIAVDDPDATLSSGLRALPMMLYTVFASLCVMLAIF